MAISSIPSSTISDLSIRNNSTTNSNKTETSDIIDLEEQVNKNLEESVDYQIITRMMSGKEKNIDKATDEPDHQQIDGLMRALENSLNSVFERSKSGGLSVSADSVNISEEAFSMAQLNVTASEMSNEQASLSVSRSEEIQQSDPLALDLNGDGLSTTGVEKGVLFDINGDGIKEKSSFANAGDAFLAYDKNGNGVIDNGKELFGDNNGYQHGFAELASYDENQDGKIDKSDSIYDKLQLFSIDENDQHKIKQLSDSGISTLHLDYTDQDQAINQYDKITQLGQFEYHNGQTGIVGDLLLGHKKI